MREKYKMQAGGVLLSEIAACRNSSRREPEVVSGTGRSDFESPDDLLTTRAVPWRFHSSTK